MEFDTSKIENYLESSFETSLFRASLENLTNKDNPLRFNNFSCSMRELYRHVLERLSPDDQVKKCDWFKPVFDENRKPRKPTRRQKIIYAIRGGLNDEYTKDKLKIVIDELLSEILESYDLLSKYTHVNKNTFNISDEEVNEFSFNVLDYLLKIFSLISETRHTIFSQLHQHVSNELIRKIISETRSEIDILSQDSYIEGVEIYEFEVLSIDSENICFTGNGNISASLNYGKGDDATEIVDDFDFDFQCFSSVHSPTAILISSESISIDNSNWFEDEDIVSEVSTLQIEGDNSSVDF